MLIYYIDKLRTKNKTIRVLNLNLIYSIKRFIYNLKEINISLKKIKLNYKSFIDCKYKIKKKNLIKKYNFKFIRK